MAARKKKQRKPAALSGRDSFHVIGPEGELAAKGEATHALNVATRFAERGAPKLTVVRRSLFGPETTLYRVDRSEHGVVFTTPVDTQD
jgi:hypothetical protein